MIRRPPRSTLDRSSAASDVYKRQGFVFSKSGTSDTNRIHFLAYPGEQPVFDFSQLQLSTSTAAGFYVTGSWLHFKGLEIMNVPMPGGSSNNGIWNYGTSASPAANNFYENLNIHHITGPRRL